jgi:HSP20 family protein
LDLTSEISKNRRKEKMKASPSTRKTEQAQPFYPPSPFRLFEDFFNDWAVRSASVRGETWKPPVDIIEKDGNLILRVEVPGVDEKGIDLKLDGRVLTINGERKPESDANFTYRQVESYYGTFTRSFTLPDSADSDQIKAGYKSGVLTITIPQKPEAKSRSIAIGG